MVPAGGDGADVGVVVMVVCPTISNPDATKVAVMLFWIVCLQHPCCVFSSDGDYVSLFLFEFLTASNDFRWASVACPGVRACTLHTCILGRGDVRVCSSSDGVPNGANFPPEFGRKRGGFKCKEKIARAWLRHRCKRVKGYTRPRGVFGCVFRLHRRRWCAAVVAFWVVC